MSFRGVFIAVVLSAALIVSAFILQSRRPRIEVNRQSAALVTATGKCADCHRHETSAVVHEYEMSRHSAVGSQLPRLPSAVQGARADGPQGLHHHQEAVRGQLPGLPSRPVPAVPARAATLRRRGRR